MPTLVIFYSEQLEGGQGHPGSLAFSLSIKTILTRLNKALVLDLSEQC